MNLRLARSSFLKHFLFFIIPLLVASTFFTSNGAASPGSSYNYKFRVLNKPSNEGFITVEVMFNSTASSGSSWVFVPNSLEWMNTTLSGQVTKYRITATSEVTNTDYYFYRALQFEYKSANGLFSMNIRFNMSTGALILEQRGIFYSPQIGYEGDNAKAEIFFDSNFNVVQNLARAIGNRGQYYPDYIDSHYVLFNLQENLIRLQVEFKTENPSESTTTLKSGNNVFSFKTVERYKTYATDVLDFYDQLYNNYTQFFNVTLDSVNVQFFLPEFGTLFEVGGYVPYTFSGERLGEININIVFIRAINGTIEIIAAHELVHHFLSRAGLSPGDFLWFHEGMAQYLSIKFVSDMGYEGAKQEKDTMENGVTQLIQDLNGDDFSSLHLQIWSPSFQPPYVDVGALYVSSYYVISRLPEVVGREGLDYYGRFFKLIHGVKVNNINVLALYLSMANNASVALTLERWGFTVTDLYESPVREMVEEAGRAVEGVNPVFQPYRSFAEYFYQQALISTEQGDWQRAQSFLQLAISMANLAPLLTFLTIIAILALLVLILSKLRRKPKPVVPPPPPEVLQSTT